MSISYGKEIWIISYAKARQLLQLTYAVRNPPETTGTLWDTTGVRFWTTTAVQFGEQFGTRRSHSLGHTGEHFRAEVQFQTHPVMASTVWEPGYSMGHNRGTISDKG